MTILEKCIELQQWTIAWFNDSITDADIKQQVSTLEKNLKLTELIMEHDMEEMHQSITNLLNITLSEMHQIIE